MAQLKALLQEKLGLEKAEQQAKILARLPKTIPCPKCDGPNDFQNTNCVFCGFALNKQKYYKDSYHEQAEKDHTATRDSNSCTFHYVVSFLIPLIGYIVGAIMLASDKEERQSCGKACIITAIISSAICAILCAILWH